MSEDRVNYNDDTGSAQSMTANGGTLFIWRDDGTVEVCVRVEDMPNPQQLAAIRVPLGDLMEFVAKGIVLPARRQVLDNATDFDLLMGDSAAAFMTTLDEAVAAEQASQPDDLLQKAPASREHNKINIRRPGT